MIMESFAEHLPMLFYIVFRVVALTTIGLGAVYLLGRMLELVKSPRLKNAVAAIAIITAAYWSTVVYDMDRFTHVYEVYWWSMIYAFGGMILYVLVGFDLYERFNAWCDRKFGDTTNDDKKKEKKKGRQ